MSITTNCTITHIGQVIAKREQNLYDDSDFLALVWEPDASEPRWIEYASTRYHSYSNHAEVDAPAELRCRYEAHQATVAQESCATKQRCDAATPTKGKRVRVTRGRKIPRGTEGVVFWYGQQTEFGAFYRNGYKAAARDRRNLVNSLAPPADGIKDGYRVGLKTDAGEKMFTAATNVDVIE
jgi:hypothetical protein